MQDCFAALLRSWATVDRPAAWLRVAVVNRCTSWVRRIKVERRYAERVGAIEAHTTDAGAVDVGRLAVVDLLKTLRPRERAVLVLRFVEGWTEQEVAEALSMPLGSVKSTTSRARARLREVLIDED